MKERFQQWYSEGFSKKHQMNEEAINIVSWLFTFYYEVSLFLKQKNHPKINDQAMLWMLNSYINDALENKWSLDQVKNKIMREIEKNILFIIPDMMQYKNELIQLVTIADQNSKNLSKEDFDVRIKLNLSSTHDYYLAKKMVMQHYITNKADSITQSMLSKIINVSKKYKFDSRSQDDESLVKLIKDITLEINNDTNIQNMLVINKINHAIRIASTARGTTPVKHMQVDFWNLDNRWEKKAQKSKYASVIGKLSDQQYSGAGNIKKSLEYIKHKVSKYENLDGLYDSVIQKIKEDNGDISHVNNSEIAKTILNKIRAAIEDLNKGEKNVRSIALLSMINGYQNLCEKLSLAKSSDKIIELLILQELYTLITKNLVITENEKIVELIYRSCVDLMSVMIVLQLDGEDKQAIFSNDVNVISPKIMCHSELEKNSSYILVGKGGRDSLGEGLKLLLNRPLMDIPRLPGFRLKTVLSQGKGEDEKEKDIAVYFEVGGYRGDAKEVKEQDDIACVGRISETIFNLSQDEINHLNENVMTWCQNVSDKPKTLCVDLTITKPNDELVLWLQSPDIKKLIQEKKLDILIWQSEQKQHSLGTGKFSAGSVYLLSGDQDKITKFNNRVSVTNKEAPDNNLSTFFRHYCSDAMHEVVKQQTESAQFIAEQLNSGLDKSYGITAVANGPFITIMMPEKHKEALKSLLEKIWPMSWSFGFSQTTITSWDQSSIRISVGLESQKILMQEASEIIKGSNNPAYYKINP